MSRCWLCAGKPDRRCCWICGAVPWQLAWMPAEIVYLRQNYYRLGAEAVAVQLGRTEKAVRSKAKVLRIVRSRRWKPGDIEHVRQHYRKRPAWEIAEELDRTLTTVYQMARKLGLHQPPRHLSPDDLAELRRLHGAGLVDTEIAQHLHFSSEAVRDHRSRLGLARNEEGILRLRRQAIRTQRARLGIRTAGELRALSFRRYAVENGWPEDLRPREVQILNALAARGVPMTRLELARAIGMRTDRLGWRGGASKNGTLELLVGNGPGGTYTASLLRRGLLAKLKRKSPGDGRKGSTRDLYLLGPEALAILERRARWESETNLQVAR